jgi:hypothetical protein
MSITPHVLYAVWWRDRVNPEYEGVMTATGPEMSEDGPVTVFTSYREALAAAKRIEFRQEVRVVEWHLREEES